MRAQALGALVLSGSLTLAGCSGGSTQAGPSPSLPAPSPASSAAPSSAPSSAPTTTGTPTGAATPAAAAPCTVPTALQGQDIQSLPIKKKRVALTFDGGSGAQGADSILGTLQARGVPGTFFLTGRFARTFPETSARIGAEHLLGNHTMTHPDLTTLSDEEVVAEVRKAQRVIRRKSGQDPRRFFRFPFGARDPHTIEVVNGLCYVPFRWTVDTLGWKGTSGGQSVQSVVQRVSDAAQPGAIVLMHLGANPDDGSTLDADALPRIIKKLRADGYSFVRLSRILPPEP